MNIEDDAFSFKHISRKGSMKSNTMSVDDERDLKSIMASLLKSAPSPTKAGNFIDLSAETPNHFDGDEELRVLRFKPSNTLFGKRRKTIYGGSNSKPKNEDPSFVCEICVETKSSHESFGIKNCSHVYCTDCVVNYVDSKLQENVTSIGCPIPNCNGLLDPEYCRLILKPEMFEKWGRGLCEAVIVGSQKFYCLFKDCSAMLIDDRVEVVRDSECPNCNRMFCAQCKVPWHAGIECTEFKKLNKNERENEDIMLRNLAQKNQWRRCPMCRFYVERSLGCDAMRCRSVSYLIYALMVIFFLFSGSLIMYM